MNMTKPVTCPVCGGACVAKVRGKPVRDAKDAALVAIQNILGDTDVAPETTVDTLVDLRDTIDDYVAVIREEHELD